MGKNGKKDLDNKNKANEFLPPPQPIRNYTYMRQRYKTGGDTEEKAYSSRYRKNDFVKASPIEITILVRNVVCCTTFNLNIIYFSALGMESNNISRSNILCF